MVIGPKILGNATNVIFNGVIGKNLPAGMTKAQAIASLRAHGQGQLADMVSGMNAVPGRGRRLHGQLGRILALAAPVYAWRRCSAGCRDTSWPASRSARCTACAATSRTSSARLPLRYFDSHPHGDILSRVTNDIDNLTTTLQQGLSQLLTSVLTVVGVLGMMFWISPLLAGIAIVTVPLSLVVTVLVAKRSQPQFAAQWERTGTLNGHVEEMHTGHALVQVFGRRERAIAEFDRQNEGLYEASFRAQFLSGIIQPAMQFLANLNYVGDRGHRRLPRGLGHDVARRRAGVHPVLAPVHDADHADRQPDEPAAVGARLGRAGLRVPRRRGGARPT